MGSAKPFVDGFVAVLCGHRIVVGGARAEANVMVGSCDKDRLNLDLDVMIADF